MPDDVIIECPRCGVEQADYDGFGVVFCASCGFCTHPSVTNDCCDICQKDFAPKPESLTKYASGLQLEDED